MRRAEPVFHHRRVQETPAQLARQAEIGKELVALALLRRPERYAPDGTPLIECAGSTWTERLESWQRRGVESARLPAASAREDACLEPSQVHTGTSA